MKRYIVVLFALVPYLLSAQVEYATKSVTYNKQNVDVAFDLNSGEKTLKNNLKMVLTPFLHNGADTLWFDSVEIYGSIKHKRERQEQALKGNKDWKLSQNQIMEGGSYSFSATTPYKGWMKGATLSVDRRVLGCGCDCYDGVENLAEGLDIYNPPMSDLAVVAPSTSHYEVVDSHKQYLFDEQDMRVIFPVSVTELKANLYNNQSVLDRIVAAIKSLSDSDEQQLNAVEIVGFASPEGGVKFNTELGEGRAAALRDYIQSQLPHMKSEQFYIINGVENWGGLREQVAQSDMAEKQQILNIIDTKSGEERKTALKRLNKGKSYRYMLKNFYPQLRNACYIKVYFDELADVASDQINKANEMIRSREYEKALEILAKYESDSRAWNSIGVCMMHLEHVDQAIYWFEKAIEAGSAEAVENLKYLK